MKFTIHVYEIYRFHALSHELEHVKNNRNERSKGEYTAGRWL
jgi:hypothetical protein